MIRYFIFGTNDIQAGAKFYDTLLAKFGTKRAIQRIPYGLKNLKRNFL